MPKEVDFEGLRVIDSEAFWGKMMSTDPKEIPKKLDLIFDNVAKFIEKWEHIGDRICIDSFKDNNNFYSMRSKESFSLLINLLVREDTFTVPFKLYFDALELKKRGFLKSHEIGYLLPPIGTHFYEIDFILSIFNKVLNEYNKQFICDNNSWPLKNDVISELWVFHLYYSIICKRIIKIESTAFSKIESYFTNLIFLSSIIIEYFDYDSDQYDSNIKFTINRATDGLNNKDRVFLIMQTSPQMIKKSKGKYYSIANKIRTNKWKIYFPDNKKHTEKPPALNTILKYVKEFLE